MCLSFSRKLRLRVTGWRQPEVGLPRNDRVGLSCDGRARCPLALKLLQKAEDIDFVSSDPNRSSVARLTLSLPSSDDEDQIGGRGRPRFA